MKIQPINLYIIDMSHSTNTSGVDRYVKTLIGGLKLYPNVKVHWIHLRHEISLLFPKEEVIEHYTKYTIPLPQEYNNIIAERFWIRKYNEQVFRLTQHLFEGKENGIIHLHTLNLIDLALLIKEKTNFKIITHLHCIPWKGLYDSDRNRFNHLYKLTYTNERRNTEKTPDLYLTNNCELQSYTEPDALICVTNCAVDFLEDCIGAFCSKTKVIPNGIGNFNDLEKRHRYKSKNDTFECLYVGAVTESKGVLYILKSLRLVQKQGYKVALTIAGNYTSEIYRKITTDFSDLEINLLGRISFDKLKEYYANSDIGIMASLQEQASYVAIEMAMFGLPIVTTAVDGLDEIFTDEVNALKVDTIFSPVFGLSVDTKMMANQIIRLIENNELRGKLSKNIRTLYEKELNLELMIKRTIDVYNSLVIDIK